MNSVEGSAILTVVMSAFAVGIFVYGLDCPFSSSRRVLNGHLQQPDPRVLRSRFRCRTSCIASSACPRHAIGVLPGIGPLVTIAMLFPLTFNLPPMPALIMLAGIYYGAQYGGSTTSILVNLPGETASAVTCLDGYQMARQGRAGPALAIAALASFFAGCVGTLLIALVGPPLAEVALVFGAAEYFALMLMALVASAVLAQGDVMKALAMVVLGLLLGIVGTDVNSGMSRYTFGCPELTDGIGFTVIAVGLFAVCGDREEPRSREQEKHEVFTKNQHL